MKIWILTRLKFWKSKVVSKDNYSENLLLMGNPQYVPGRTISCPAAGALLDTVLLADIADWSWAAGAVGAVGAAGAIGITGSTIGTMAAACISAAIVSSISESAYRVKHKSQIFSLCLQHEFNFEPEFRYYSIKICVFKKVNCETQLLGTYEMHCGIIFNIIVSRLFFYRFRYLWFFRIMMTIMRSRQDLKQMTMTL